MAPDLQSSHWAVTLEAQRLLQPWRFRELHAIRTLFCQVEVAETAIWLTEVAPSFGEEGRRLLDDLADSNEYANPGLPRLALKFAMGAGKTAVMYGHAHRLAHQQSGRAPEQQEVCSRLLDRGAWHAGGSRT